ncbi:MAG: hypothetical protein AAGI68_04765 [Planctomycetota bacterium]
MEGSPHHDQLTRLFEPDAQPRWRTDWLDVPPHIRLGITHGIEVDPQGKVYVLHTVHETSPCRDAVCVFDADGRFLRSWGDAFAGSGHGIRLFPEQNPDCVYITDLKRGLFKTTLDGQLIWHVERPAFYNDRPHLPYEPTNVAVTPEGEVFLSDGYGSYLIHRFTADGQWLDAFGGPGTGNAHFAHPHGIHYTERRGEPELLVAENIATRMNYVSLTGEHRGFLEVETRRPRTFVELDGLLVVPDFYGRVTLIDADDRLIGHLGDTWQGKEHAEALEAQPPPEGFIRPHDAAIAADGALLVSEYVNAGRVVRITPDS